MVLADTTIWIDHLRAEEEQMSWLLNRKDIVMHPFVIGELALGSLRDRALTLATLDLMPRTQVAQNAEVRRMIEARSLYCRGIGLTDAHLIASCLLAPNPRLWTRDKRLHAVAEEIGIHANLR
jgi:hypothetical protein